MSPRPEESEAIVLDVCDAVATGFSTNCISVITELKGNRFTFDVHTKDLALGKILAAEFSEHHGDTMKQLGDLDIDF